MSDDVQKNKKNQLALALAQGDSASAWARANNVPPRTAQRWAKDPGVRRIIEKCRRRWIDQTVGRLTNKSTWAVDKMIGIAGDSQSHSVQLKACKSILSQMLNVSNASGLINRVTDLEGRFYEVDRETNRPA